ncbi:MAG TPA: cobalamin biosynthesis protein, partial [Ramlibacter sp.]|nr:cobalamin biosynthesis protein [Ramlibacter sp.]
GWPAAALALALGTRLRKPGVSVLNGTGAYPEPEHTLRALNLAGRAVAVMLAWTCVAFVLAWERPW